MNKSDKIRKLELEKKVLLFEYDLKLDEISDYYTDKISNIDNKLYELQRVGFVIPYRGKKYNIYKNYKLSKNKEIRNLYNNGNKINTNELCSS